MGCEAQTLTFSFAFTLNFLCGFTKDFFDNYLATVPGTSTTNNIRLYCEWTWNLIFIWTFLLSGTFFTQSTGKHLKTKSSLFMILCVKLKTTSELLLVHLCQMCKNNQITVVSKKQQGQKTCNQWSLETLWVYPSESEGPAQWDVGVQWDRAAFFIY